MSTTNYLQGIDVSKWQGDIDWAKVKKSGKCDFAILRAGYGKLASQKDPKFDENYKAAKEQGIPVGVYWYSYATTEAEALLEVEACLTCIADKVLDYPVFYDVEESNQISSSIAKKIIPTFIDGITAKGYKCGLYSYASALTTFGNSITSKYDIWVAHFDVDKPSFSGNYTMWQYTEKGSISGISGEVDMDYCYTTYSSTTGTTSSTTTGTTSSTTTGTTSSTTTGTTSSTTTGTTSSTTYKAGDKVTLNNTGIYASSDATSYTSKKSGTYYIYSTDTSNGRIRITNDKSNVGKTPAGDYVTGWVNVSDIGGTTSSSTTTSSTTYKAGDKVTLKSVRLYASSDATSYTSKKSGTYYIYSTDTSNGRIRITNDKSNVGKTPAGDYVTGWVNINDL